MWIKLFLNMIFLQIFDCIFGPEVMDLGGPGKSASILTKKCGINPKMWKECFICGNIFQPVFGAE